MARRRFFNRNQPRDSHGRWTSGGGSKRSSAPKSSNKFGARNAKRSAARSSNKFAGRRKELTGAQLRKKTQRLNTFSRYATATTAGAYVGTLALPGAGTVAGAFVGAGAAVATRGRRRKKKK